MNDLGNSVANGFIRNFTDFAQRVETLAAELSAEQFWQRPYSYGNSFGNLVLHLTGNLNYYIGAQIAHTGYVREREREFTDTYPGQKDEVLAKLADTVEMVIATVKAETSESWTEAYQAVGANDSEDRFGGYLRCAVHFHHHIGQMIYLVKELTKEV